jgi:PTH1 family peptidyl-tRNA hydrolase
MKVIVGLGNPGARYEKTRHNVGFEVVERLCARCQVRLRRVPRLQARVAEYAGAVLVAPETFMNRSGYAVRLVCKQYGVSPEQVLVVCDDMSLAPMKVRFRSRGSAGGHNGLKSIISELGGDTFGRIKIGIGHPGDPQLAADFVLSSFTSEEWRQLEPVLDLVADSCLQWIEGLDLSLVLNAKLQNMS